LEYFQFANVFGVDIVKNTNPYNDATSNVHPRYRFIPGDQGDADFWKQFVDHCGPTFDVVIDDGSHYASDIITTFRCLWPHVSSSGLYIIEDLNTAYGGAPFTVPGEPTQMDFIKDFLDAINRETLGIEKLHFSKELCIIQKKSHV
jgi:hypothetical protein